MRRKIWLENGIFGKKKSARHEFPATYVQLFSAHMWLPNRIIGKRMVRQKQKNKSKNSSWNPWSQGKKASNGSGGEKQWKKPDDDDEKEEEARESKKRSGIRRKKEIKQEDQKSKCPLEIAKSQLHTSCLPHLLLKRKTEYKEIRNFIQNGIISADGKASRVLYISGVPGTGKTASVLKVLKDLKSMKSFPKFHFVNINGLELSDPKMAYQAIFREINKGFIGARRKMSPREAQQILNERFTEEEEPGRLRKKPVIMLVDEVDMLYTKREEVLYTLFNWASLEQSRCSVIAISNTLDLAERKFSQRIISRMGNNRMTFQPYEFHEIEAILKYRLNLCPEIKDKAIELTSKKVASISGDLRKALELMRRAIEIALEECEEQDQKPEETKLESRHVMTAISESQSSIRMQFVRALSSHELLLFRALVRDLHDSALEETTFCHILHHYRLLCYGDGLHPLPLEAAFHHMKQMDEMHLVILASDKSGGGEYRRRVQLGFPLSEAQFCIRQLALGQNNIKSGSASLSASPGSLLSIKSSPATPTRSPSTGRVTPPRAAKNNNKEPPKRRSSRYINFEEESKT